MLSHLLFLSLIAEIVLATPYNEEMATLGVYYSNAVKCDPSAVLQWKCGPSCSKAGTLQNITMVYNDTLQVRAFVGYDASRKNIVISFRGSITFLNWIEDADVFFMKYPGFISTKNEPSACGPGECKVHSGFYSTYAFLAETILPAFTALARAFPQCDGVFITGHSLGAAQAQFAILDVQHLVKTEGYPLRVFGINFGCPRAGNDAFADWAGQQAPAVWRVVHDEDPVPMFPFTIMGYRHFPRDFIWYNHQLTNRYVLCNQTGVDTREASCGGAYLKMNGTDHVWYLGLHMDCSL